MIVHFEHVNLMFPVQPFSIEFCCELQSEYHFGPEQRMIVLQPVYGSQCPNPWMTILYCGVD
jgi:hypothetical protein